MESGEFKKFNYGPKMNEKKYGSKKAPFYNLSAVTVPIRMFYGTGDILASPKVVNFYLVILCFNWKVLERAEDR